MLMTKTALTGSQYHARIPTHVTKLVRIGTAFYKRHLVIHGHAVPGNCADGRVIQWGEPTDHYKSGVCDVDYENNGKDDFYD